MSAHGMSTSQLCVAILRAERLGSEWQFFTIRRDRAPKDTVRVLPGVMGRVVGTERDGERWAIIVRVRVADVRRFYERTVAQLPDDMPDDMLGLSAGGA